MTALRNRRDFIKTAAISGATAWAGLRLAAGFENAQEEAFAETSISSTESASSVPVAPPDRQPSNLSIPESASRKVGWAIVGLGQLALEEIMPAFSQCHLSQPVALVSGHPEKARKVADTYDISSEAIYSYEDYDRIVENDRIEVVYVVLPNSMHAEFTSRALRAGKHVLCEKPMAVNITEGEQMIAAARQSDRKLMIAYRLHYEPKNMKVMELCGDEAYGKIKTFSSSNCQNVQAPNIRLSRSLGGGPVGDVGIYSINAARYVIGEEPVEATAFFHRPDDDPRFREVPESVSFILRYPSGVLAHCDCSFGTTESRRYRVHCENGYVEMDPAFSYRGLRLHVKDGESTGGTARISELVLPDVNHFAAEMDHFSECVLNNTDPKTPGEMGVADLRIIAAIEESLKTSRAVQNRNRFN